MQNMTKENLQEYLKVPGIYQIKIGDKEYIGSSCSIGHRLKHHLWALNSKKHHNRTMQNCWNKYGEAGFRVIEECEEDILIEREAYYIKELDPHMNHILDPQKIERDEIYRQRLSESLKKAYAEGLQPHNKQEVYMYNFKGKYVRAFASISEAGEYFNTDPSGICAALNGRAASAQKHLWSTSKQDQIKIPNKNYQRVSVTQYDMEDNKIKKWASVKIAEIELNISNIHRAASKNRTAGGFKWKFE